MCYMYGPLYLGDILFNKFSLNILHASQCSIILANIVFTECIYNLCSIWNIVFTCNSYQSVFWRGLRYVIRVRSGMVKRWQLDVLWWFNFGHYQMYWFWFIMLPGMLIPVCTVIWCDIVSSHTVMLQVVFFSASLTGKVFFLVYVFCHGRSVWILY